MPVHVPVHVSVDEINPGAAMFNVLPRIRSPRAMSPRPMSTPASAPVSTALRANTWVSTCAVVAALACAAACKKESPSGASAGSSTSAAPSAAPAAGGGKIVIGVLADMSGLYADVSGKGSVIAAQMAVDELGGTVAGMPVEVVSADHQNKPDVGSA